MAAKDPAKDPGLAPELNNGIDYRGNVAYDFDLGAPDKAFTCASCHSGGILEFDRQTGVRHDLEETWTSSDGSGFFSPVDYADNEIDGDLFSYTPDEYSRGYLGKPHKFNWKKSGVLDVDCFLCHADRSQDLSVKSGMWSADAPTPANPRVFVFEKKDPSGNVTEISLGFPPSLNATEIADNYTIDSANFYSNPLERIVSFYYGQDISNCLGADAGNMTLRSIVTGELAEAIRKGALYSSTYSIDIINPFTNSTICTLNATTAPDLGNFTKTFFLDPGAPNFSARDYLRNAFYESTTEGQPYVDSGMFLRAANATTMFAYNPMDPNVPFIRLARAGFFFGWADSGTLMGVADPNDASRPIAFVRLEKQSDGTFKAVTYYASDVDLSAVQLPILETDGHYTLCSADTGATDGVAKVHTGDNDDSLTYMCAQCHFAMPDEKNRWVNPLNPTQSFPSWYVRRGIIGMGADVVKRGAVFSRESENDVSDAPIAMNPDGTIANPDNATAGLPGGYDVHFDKNKGDLSCLSCHGQDNLSEEQRQYHNPHNFLKGNDSAGEVDPALDYNPPVQTCIKCHWGSEAAAAAAHTVFGPAAATHISKIECQVCHIPYKTYWTFRFFNDLVGYSNNFDDRLKSFTFDNATGNVTMQQFPPEWAIPAFAATPTYGVNFAYTITQTTDDGGDVIVPMTLIDMDLYRALMRWNDNGTMFGLWATGANPQMKPYLFPYRWAPVIVKRYTIDDAGNQVLRAGLINPIIVATWMDASTNRVLFIRELNAAVNGTAPVGGSTIDPEKADKGVPGIVMRPASEAEEVTGKPAISIKDANGVDTGMVAAVQLINGKYIYDNDGDMVPEIDTPEEYEAMKEALTEVLDKEDPNHPHNPVIFVGMAPFGVDHGVLPASYALGAQQSGPLSCSACHSSDESKNRLSPAVYSGDMTKGRFVTLLPFALPKEAIDDSKKYGGWKLPAGVTSVTTPDGRQIMGATQGAFMNFVSVPVESKEYAAYALVTPAQSDTVIMDGVTISYPKNAVDTPTMIKVEKVEDASIEESALEAAKAAGIQTPVMAGKIYKIETKNNEFNLPVNFTLPYEAYKVSDKVVLLTSEDGKNWKVLTSQAINPDNPRISFSTTKLSYFAIVGPAASNVVSPVLPTDCSVVSEDNGTSATVKVVMPDLTTMNVKASVSGGYVDDSVDYQEMKDEIEDLAKEEKIAEVVIPVLKIIPETNATSVNATFEGIPEDKISSIAAYVKKGTELLPESVVEVEKYPAEGKVVVKINLASKDITRATDDLYLTLGVPASAVLPSTSTTNAASGGGGGCSLAPATTASSGLASFGAMLSGLLGLAFGRRRKKKQ